MATRPITDAQILEAEKHVNQARARLSDLKAQKQKMASTEKRKLDARRKILVGAVVLKKLATDLATDAEAKVSVYQWLDKGLTQPVDRAAFPELQKLKS